MNRKMSPSTPPVPPKPPCPPPPKPPGPPNPPCPLCPGPPCPPAGLPCETAQEALFRLMNYYLYRDIQGRTCPKTAENWYEPYYGGDNQFVKEYLFQLLCRR